MKKILSFLFVVAVSAQLLNAQILVSTGSGGNYDISSYPGNFTGYYDGFSVIFRANHNNPASYAKMRIGAFAQVDIYNTAGNALAAGDIKANQIITLIYDASTSRFQMVTTSGNVSGGGGGISGTGTASYLTRWATASTLGNSVIFDDGAKIGIDATSPLVKLDVRGSNPKSAAFIFETIFQVASNEAASPLALRMGIQTSATATNRYGAIEVDDAGVKRKLELQPNGGDVNIGSLSGTGGTFNMNGPAANFYNPSGPMNISVSGSLVNGSVLTVDGFLRINTPTSGANAVLALKNGHIQTLQASVPTYSVNATNVSSATVTGTDVAGVISYSITAAAGTGAYVTVIFDKPYTSPPVINITPQNPIAGAAYNDKKMYVTANTNGFTIYHGINANSGNIISSSTASFYYLVIDR